MVTSEPSTITGDTESPISSLSLYSALVATVVRRKQHLAPTTTPVKKEGKGNYVAHAVKVTRKVSLVTDVY